MRNSQKALFALSTAAAAVVGWTNHAFAVNITPGDLIVFQQQNTQSAKSGASIQLEEITTSGTTIQTITDNTLYTDGAPSEGYLSLSTGGTQISYDGYTSSGSTENTITTRAVGVLNMNGSVSYPAGTTYTSVSGKNARSAYSADGVNWYVGDQSSLYYNGTALTGGPSSVHSLVSAGGITYSFSGSNVSAITPSSPTPGTTSVSLTPIVSDPQGNPQDITLVSSGNNGSSYDTLYLTDNTSSTNGFIYKYADINGTWTTEGDVSLTSSTIAGHTLEDITSEIVNGQVELFITADSGSHGWLYEITDSAAYNANISLGSATLIAESASNNQFAGVVVVPEPASIGILSIATIGLLARRRRTVA